MEVIKNWKISRHAFFPNTISKVMKKIKQSKIQKYHAECFLNTHDVMFPGFNNLQYITSFEKKTWNPLFNIFEIILLSIFNNSQKLILNKFTTYFWMKIYTWSVQTPREFPK